MDAVDLGSSLCVSFTMKPQEKMIIEGSCGLGFKMPSLWDSIGGCAFKRVYTWFVFFDVSKGQPIIWG